ncbi:MAG: cell wall-binding repeat-containing protein [Coriobacteriia bacterium]
MRHPARLWSLLSAMVVLVASLTQSAYGVPTASVRPLARWRVSRPVGIENAADGSGRLFIVDKGGVIRVVSGGQLLATPFLDISGLVSGGGEQGLLGLAFPPGFGAKQYFYIDYTNTAGDTVVARVDVSADPNVADAASRTVLLTIDQPFANHNGGQIAFGPDGYLYIGMGDGGSSGDPLGNGQATNTLLGKMLRIDTESGSVPYAVPPTNPFAGNAAYLPEIWSIGLRNPWRFSFDPVTGAMYIADVGQSAWEEIDVEPPATGGRNYGWNGYEGSHSYPVGSAPGPTAGLTFPVHEYDHATRGHSITGGYVYRGARYPAWDGLYFFGDFEWGTIWAMDTGDHSVGTALDTPLLITTFGRDEAGELYFAEYLDSTVYEMRNAAVAPQVPVTRLSGSDRYATAAAIALEAFPSGCTTAVVATGEGFADALSASGLAGVAGGPVLLTRSRVASPAMLSALGPAGLAARDVIIVGGTTAVTSAVEATLRGAGYSVSRVSGSDRYATAAAVASRVVARLGAAYDGNVFVARGDEYPDALAASPLSYAGHGPILLTAPAALPAVTAGALTAIGATDAIVIGGTDAITPAVAGGLGVPYVRVAGADRYSSASGLASVALGRGWTDYSFVGIATGLDFPDGLAGGAAAGTRGGVLLLAGPTLPRTTREALIGNQGRVTAAEVYGGASAISGETGQFVRWHLP